MSYDKDFTLIAERIKREFDEMYSSSSYIKSPIINEILDYSDNIIVLKAAKKRNDLTNQMKLNFENVEEFKNLLSPKSILISTDIKSSIGKEIVVLEDEIILNNSKEVNIIKLENFKRVTAKYNFINSNINNRILLIDNPNVDLISITIFFELENEKNIEYNFGLFKYVRINNENFELKYDLEQIRENLINIFFNSYKKFKQKKMVIEKL